MTIYRTGDDAAVDTYRQRLAHAMALGPVWKQTELAAAIGVTKATINQVLGGRSEALSAPNSAAAAHVLRVEHRWLALGIGEPRPFMQAERLALSEKAVYIGQAFDAIDSEARRAQAYALIVRLLEFGADDPQQTPPTGA